MCNRTWIAPVNHGYHMVADLSYSRNWEEESEHDSVVVQREQMDGIELCFFGVFDTQIGDKVIKFMQTHFFDKNFKQVKSQHSLHSFNPFNLQSLAE